MFSLATVSLNLTAQLSTGYVANGLRLKPPEALQLNCCSLKKLDQTNMIGVHLVPLQELTPYSSHFVLHQHRIHISDQIKRDVKHAMFKK